MSKLSELNQCFSCDVLTVGRQVTFGKFLFILLSVITLLLCLVSSYVVRFSIYSFTFHCS